MAEERNKREQFISELGKGLIQHAHKTNDISRTYLMLAAEGQVSSRLFDLANAICNGVDVDEISGVLESAIAVGHNSGFSLFWAS